ncbi:MAG TPA: thiamine pyrophosphate-dependent dehydrogenase E1 component subunit alpha [Bryobacteraceae bacterium]|jgi:pyruvate dehydrogenase E1 component alpha subunit|nr:thiamine pyrophosphate-dependent dehydrogenase E1 component subunit alpha [Bryobacteraceae bacterium]
MSSAAAAEYLSNSEPSADVMVEMYRKMKLIELCDERIRATLRSGRMASPHYSPRGQEAISAAVAVNLNPDDYMITIYRGLHDHLAKGTPLRELWAEYAGRATGSCKGKGGPMHITHLPSGVMVTTGIVGSGLPVANGFGLASVVKGDGKVTVTNFGDGASNIGAFHEALNLASLWKLPVIFVCQNNRYGEHTAYARTTSSPEIASRAASYSMPGVRIDGNNPVQVWKAMKVGVDRARAGEGPTLIEAMTFRFHGHNYGDPGEYIPDEEMAAALAADPIPIFRKRLLDDGLATEAILDEIVTDIEAELDDAVEFALNSAFPDFDELRKDVFKEEMSA